MNNTESKKSWQEEYGKVVGIDLGTTNSVIAAIEGGIPKIISNREGSRTTPSVVAFTKNEEIVVGQLARQTAEPQFRRSEAKKPYVIKFSTYYIQT